MEPSLNLLPDQGLPLLDRLRSVSIRLCCCCRSLASAWRAEDIEFRVLGNARALWARHVATIRSNVVRSQLSPSAAGCWPSVLQSFAASWPSARQAASCGSGCCQHTRLPKQARKLLGGCHVSPGTAAPRCCFLDIPCTCAVHTQRRLQDAWSEQLRTLAFLSGILVAFAMDALLQLSFDTADVPRVTMCGYAVTLAITVRSCLPVALQTTLMLILILPPASA